MTGRDMTDEQVETELRKINPSYGQIFLEAIEDKLDEVIEVFRLLAKSQRALREIKGIVNSRDIEIMQKVERIDKIAREHWKEGSNG